MQQKAQAAMEFLTTYSWAFLIILVMIGTLAYFGVFNPQTATGDRCISPPGFVCENYQLNTDMQKITLTNQQGSTINIISDTIKLIKKESNASCTLVEYNNLLPDKTIEFICSGNSQNINIKEGEKVKLELNFKYYKKESGITFNKPTTTQIVATVLQ